MQIVSIKKIRIDCGTQSREKINEDIVSNYAEAMENGDQFPPVKIFHDGINYYLADGFHRLFACKKLNRSGVEAEVVNGTLSEAILYSLKSNAKHGLPRTIGDRKKSVMTMLDHIEWSTWSNAEIARQCEVSVKLVAQMRKGSEPEVIKYKDKDGEIREREVKPKKETKKEEEKKEEKKEERVVKYDPKDDLIHILTEDNENLNKRLADKAFEGTPEEKKLLDQLVQDLKKENKLLRIEVESLKKSRDTYQNENDQMRRQIKKLEKKIKDMDIEIIPVGHSR